MTIPEPKLENLYQEMILDHNRNPRNFKEIPGATAYAHGVNPLCGDDYQVYLKTNAEGVIEDIGFKGAGCAISKSSASVMTTLVKGKNIKEAGELKNYFLEMMTKDEPKFVETNAANLAQFAKRVDMFHGVKEFPVRVKCATLAWHTLADALKDVK